MSDSLGEFWDSLRGPERTPEQKAHSKGYSEGYRAAVAEQRRKDGLREQFAEDDITPLWDKLMRKEPLTAEEAIRVGMEVHLVMEKHVSNGSLLMHLFEELIREYAKGKRCAVCCRYGNPDCITEC